MYAYGKKVALEILNNDEKITKIILYKDFDDKSIISIIKKRNINIQFLDKKQMDKLVDGNHQGIILVINEYQYYTLENLMKLTRDDNSLLLILDHLEDPHNLGAIIRTAEASGVNGIIIPKNRAVDINSTVIKTSVGASNYIPIAKVSNLNHCIKELKKSNFWIVGADMNGVDYRSVDYNMNVALVIGNEGKGLSKLVKESCDHIVSIPMRGKINSLNASVAAGVLIYEVIRNR